MSTKKEKQKRRDRFEKERIKLKRQLERDNAALASDEPFLEEDVEEVSDEEEIVEEPEDTEKSMSEDMMPVMGGPTSFSELDEVRKVQEKNAQVQSAAWDVQDLVRNIVSHPMLSISEKSDAIKAVGKEFGSRITALMSEQTKKELDMELLETEAILAKDFRATPVSERIGNWVSKAVLTASAENKLSDSQFALVVTRDGKKIRKYPIHDKAHVRNALARAAQMIKRGGEAAADARAALPKIRAAAKRMGIGTMEKSQSAVVIEKDASGSWRAVMWPSNNFKDWDGEIISEKAHLEYVDWVNKNMDVAPVFATWHKPGTARQKQVDFVSYENGFLLMSAPLTEDEAAALLKAQTITDIGMSHGSLVFERDAKDPRVINKYRMVEVSDLPLENAANPFTDFATLTKEANMKTLEYLTAILGSEEKAKAYLDKTEGKQKALLDAGVESKEKVETPTPEPSPAPDNALELPKQPDTKEIVAQVLKELDIEGLQEFLTKSQEAMEKVPVLEELVKSLSGDRNEWFAKQIAPPVEKKFIWSKRPSQDPANVLKEGEEDGELKNADPALPENWLAGALNTTPIQQ